MIFGSHLFLKRDYYNFAMITISQEKMRELNLCFLFALLLFFFGCGVPESSPHEDLLYQVECQFQIMPDSAFRVLDNLDASLLSEKEAAHRNLLMAQSMYFLSRDPQAIDSLLDEAGLFFAKSDDRYHEAMVYWQKSGIGAQLGQGQQYVMDYRQKALQTIEQCQHVDHRLVQYSLISTNEQNEIDRLKYAIHQRLGMSYTAGGYHREGIKHLLLSEQYYYKQKRYNLHLGSAYMLGHAYNLVAEYDSSLMYYNKGLQSAQAMGNVAECAYYYNAVGDGLLFRYDTQTDATDDARLQMLRQSVSYCMTGLEMLENVNDRMAFSYRMEMLENLSQAYFNLQDYDSCIYYGSKVFDFYGDKTSEFQLKRLYNSYKALGDNGKAAIFADLILNLPDDHGSEQKAIAEVKDEYDKQLELQRLESEQQVKRYRLYLWIALLVIGLMVVLWMTFRYRKNKELETLKLREAQRQLQTELEQLTTQQKEMLQQQAMAIYQAGQKDRLQRILAAFEAAYPHTLEKIQSAYPDLNESERRVVILSFLGFRAKEVADLLGLTENTAMKYRSNIRKKVGDNPFSSLLE